MRRIGLLLFALLSLLRTQGQEMSESIAVVPQEVQPAYTLSDSWTADSLHLPLLNHFGQVPYIGIYPYTWGGFANWELHQGLNASIDASAFASFGKNVYHGVGFGQNVALMYAMPIDNKLSVALGGYVNNVFWAHNTYRDAGLNAVLSYRFNDHWEAFLYGQKSLVDKKMPMPLYDLGNIGDRLGLAVKYNFSPSFSIQVNVEKHDYQIEGPAGMPYPPMHNRLER